MEERKPQELEFNIYELEGEPVRLNLGEKQEVEGEFEKQIIHAPDDFSFDEQTVKVVLDGFTQGALKNILTISREKIRLYKVTKDSIEIVSCSKQSTAQKAAFVAQKNTCSVQAFPYT